MKLVMDANIFVSASFWGGLPRILVNRVFGGIDTLLVTDDVVDEINNVITRTKFNGYKNFYETPIKVIKAIGEKVTVLPKHRLTEDDCRDPKDIKYLECAIAGNADCIISGDKDLLALKNIRGIRIMTPKEYLNIVTSVNA